MEKQVWRVGESIFFIIVRICIWYVCCCDSGGIVWILCYDCGVVNF